MLGINMYMKRNDPNDDRLYNYCYKITNNKTGRIYIGVHRTDNLDDGYIGSGKLLKRAIQKHGISFFTKEILMFFETYKEALAYEKKIVTPEFIEESTNYNLKEGGYGGCRWSQYQKKCQSNNMKAKWQDYEFREKMLDVLRAPSRCENISNRVKQWIIDNPELHKQRMDKINLNPEKKEKTANAHRNTKRSTEACTNIRNGIKKSLEDEQVKIRRSGRGSKYYYNPQNKEVKRFYNTADVPEGWVPGSIKNK
jgi:hypothetical protein